MALDAINRHNRANQAFRERSASLACSPPAPPAVELLRAPQPKIIIEKSPPKKASKEVSRNDVMDELCSRLVQRRKTLGHLEPTEEEEDKNLNSLKGSFPSTSTSTLSTISSISSSNCSTRSAPPIVIRDPKLSPPPPPDVSEFKSKKFDLKAGKAGKIRERSKSVFIGTSQRNDVMEELKQRLDTKRKSVILSIERIEEESTEKKLPNGDVTHASLDILHQKAKNPKAVLHPIKIETQFGKASASNSVSPNHSAPEAVKKAIPPKPADSMMNVVVNKIQTLKLSHQSIKITNRAKSSKNECSTSLNFPAPSSSSPSSQKRQKSPSTSNRHKNLLVSRFIDIWETRQNASDSEPKKYSPTNG